jgi:hypothetical protein
LSGNEALEKELQAAQKDIKDLEGKVYNEHRQQIADLCTYKTLTEKRLADLEKDCPFHGTLSKQLDKLAKQGQAQEGDRIRLQHWQEEVDKVIKDQAVTLLAVNNYLAEEQKEKAEKRGQEQGVAETMEKIYKGFRVWIPVGIAAGALLIQFLTYLANLYHKSGGATG